MTLKMNPSTGGTVRYVVVTDKLRGVYFGKTDAVHGAEFVVIQEARICFSWIASAGIGSLSVVGPDVDSKIGPEMPEFCIRDVANVSLCAPAAIKAWKASGWKN